MKDRVKINLEEEKVLRLEIPTDNGMVVINNPSTKIKNELVNELVMYVAKGEDFDEKEIMLNLIKHCTNVEFEGDIFETTNLTHEAQMITNEILLIFQEMIAEAYGLIKLAMQQMKNENLQNEILKDKEEIEEVVVEKKDVIEEVSYKSMRKPPRRRKK